jgi:hypothetical protein
MSDERNSTTEPYRPSSGDEGRWFMSQWCDHCTHDEAFQADPENNCDKGCPIVAMTLALMEDDPLYPREWISDVGGSNPRCTAFERIDNGHAIPDARQEALNV